MLDFRTETFLTLCEYMNYTKASEALGLTQPAVSGHIRYLENYYNVKLFIYENKKLHLTKQGEYLKRVLETQVHDEMKLRDELSNIREKKIYRVGATLSISDSLLSKFLAEYLSNNTKTELTVTVANTTTLLKKLDHGELDIVLSEGYFSKDDYEHRLINEEKLSVFCGIDYDSDSIHGIKDLFSHRLLSREPGSGTRAVFEHFLNDKGYSIENFENKCVFTSVGLIMKLITANIGIGVLYSCVGKDLLREGKIKEIPIPDFSLKHDFNALWQKNSIYGKDNEAFLFELKKWQENN